uniref:E3 ubiquitin-protein ligase RGLG2 n=1 Tax=Magallana gigas TaxID=29159 RepID=K1PSK1_MAGGI
MTVFAVKVAFRLVFRQLWNELSGKSCTCIMNSVGIGSKADHEDEALFVGDDRCCPICYDRNRSIAFQCGHTFCSQCSDQLTDCPNCRVKVTQRLRLFS